MTPIIKRTGGFKCCKWCSKLYGIYKYPNEVPKDVYKRHEGCTCMVEYIPSLSKRQNVHDKAWKQTKKNDIIEKKKKFKFKTVHKDNIFTKNFVKGSGKNYPISFGASNHVKFDSKFVTKVTVIAGKNTSTEIKDINRLMNIYNEPKNIWQKISGETYIRVNGKKIKAEIHWYELTAKGMILK